MARGLGTTRTRKIVGVWTLGLALLACGSEADEPGESGLDPQSASPGESLDSDAGARARLEEIEHELENLGVCSPACLETLESFRRRYPADPWVLRLLRSAYARLQDWEALVRLEETQPGARSTADRIRLAAIYQRSGRHAEAAAQLEELVREQPESVDLRRRLAVVEFELGEHERVLELLREDVEKLPASAAAEAETLRGLAYFHRCELGAAERHLTRALELDGSSVTALTSMARVLAARERLAEASEYADRAGEMRQASLAETRRLLRMSTRSRLASDACVARSWDTCERLVREMLGEATVSEQIGIYRFLSGILEQAGRPEAAREAAERAEELMRQVDGT